MKPNTSLFAAACTLLAALLLALPARAQFVIPGPVLRLNGFVFALESDAGGNVYLGGSFNDFNGDFSSGMGLLRLTAGGVKHATWDIGFMDGVNDLQVQGDFLYVAGSFSTVRTLSAGTISRPYLMRIFLTGPNEGKIDTSWAPVPNGPVSAIETDGTSLFMAGSFTNVNGTARQRMAKLVLNTAALDATWNPAPNNPVADIELANNQLYVSGGFNSIGGVSNNYLVRLSLSGTGAADAAWLPNVNRPVGELESTATHIYFGGDFTTVQGVNHRSVGRYTTGAGAASFDGTWKPDPNGEVSSIAISGGSIYMSGVFTTVGAASRRFMAKVDSGAGGVDSAFAPEPNGSIQDLKIVGGNVLAGGRFNTTTGVASAGYALMSSSNGAALPGLAGTISTDGEIYSMIPVTGGMMIGGLFDSVNGVARTSIAKVLSSGQLDTSFNVPLVGFNRLVSDMKLDGSNLYFCGDFLTAGGAPTKHVARVNASTGAVDAGWYTNPLTPILCIETDANYVYLGSSGLRFIEIAPGNAVQVYNLARVSKGATALLDQVWTPIIVDETSNPATAAVYDLQINGSNLIIGGNFTFIVNPTNTNQAFTRVSVASLSTSNWGTPVNGWPVEFYNPLGDIASVFHLLLHSNGALYVAGNFDYMASGATEAPWYGVAKLNAGTGAWDTNFDVSPSFIVGSPPEAVTGEVNAIAGLGSQIYIGGDFDYVWDNSPAPAGGYYASADMVRVSQTTGRPDLSWYPYQNDSVSTMAFAGNNLWMFGSFDMLGDTFVDGMAIVPPFSTAYQTWLSTYFTPAQIANSDYTAPFWDDDGDGDTNLVESMFNTNPFNGKKVYQTPGGSSGGLPLVRTENIGGQNVLTMEFVRWKSSTNPVVTAIPEFGDDLKTWPRAGTMIGTPTSIDANRERVKFRDPSGGLRKALGRARVESQTP